LKEGVKLTFQRSHGTGQKDPMAANHGAHPVQDRRYKGENRGSELNTNR